MTDLSSGSIGLRYASTGAVDGPDILKRFLRVVHWARGGTLQIITPFMNDFDLKSESLSARIMRIARESTNIHLMTAPPDKPWNECKNPDHIKKRRCPKCDKAAEKLKLLDKYSHFANEILIKEGLHAKVYISENPSGRKKCLTGSVNLTVGAFFHYCELGIYTTDAMMISDIEKFIARWKRKGSLYPKAKSYRIWRKDFLGEYPRVNVLV